MDGTPSDSNSTGRSEPKTVIAVMGGMRRRITFPFRLVVCSSVQFLVLLVGDCCRLYISLVPSSLLPPKVARFRKSDFRESEHSKQETHGFHLGLLLITYYLR